MNTSNFHNHMSFAHTHSQTETSVRMNLKEIQDSLHLTLERLIEIFPKSIYIQDIKKTVSAIESNRFHIFIMGEMASGKTMLMNTIIGHKCCNYMIGQRCLCSYVNDDTDYFTVRAYDLEGKEIQYLQLNSIEELGLFAPYKTVVRVEIGGRFPLAEKSHLNITITEIPPYNIFLKIDPTFFYGKQGFAIYCKSVTNMGLGDSPMLFENTFASFNLEPFDAYLRSRYHFIDEQIPTIFALTKMDILSPRDGDNVNNCIKALRDELAKANIRRAEIIPVSLLSIEKDDDFSTRELFERRCHKYPDLQLEQYSRLSEWSPYSKAENIIPYEEKWDNTDQHSGFPNLHKFLFTYLTEEILCHKIMSIASLLDKAIEYLIIANQFNIKTSIFETLHTMSLELKLECKYLGWQ